MRKKSLYVVLSVSLLFIACIAIFAISPIVKSNKESNTAIIQDDQIPLASSKTSNSQTKSNSKSSSNSDSDSRAHKKIDLPKSDDVIFVSRATLHSDAKNYKDKWIFTAGKVTAVNGSEDEGYTINFEGASSIKLIMCYMMLGQDASIIKVGDYVGIVGKGEGKLLGQAMLYSCVIDCIGDSAKEADELLSAQDGSTTKSKSSGSSLFGTSELDKDSAIAVTAKEAWKEMQDNQVACKKKYDGQVVAITGTIEDFGTNLYGQEYVILANGDKYSIGSVQCFFKNDQMDYVASLKKGDKVTLYGIAEIGSTSFKLGNCQP